MLERSPPQSERQQRARASGARVPIDPAAPRRARRSGGNGSVGAWRGCHYSHSGVAVAAPGAPVVLLRGWAHKVARGDDGDAIGAALFPRRRVVMRPGRLAAWSVRASTSKPGLPSLLPSRAPPRSVGRPFACARPRPRPILRPPALACWLALMADAVAVAVAGRDAGRHSRAGCGRGPHLHLADVPTRCHLPPPIFLRWAFSSVLDRRSRAETIDNPVARPKCASLVFS